MRPLPSAVGCRLYTHKHCAYRAVQSLHKRGTHRTRLAQELQRHLCAPVKSLSSGPHMSHPLSLSHLPCTTSTSSSAFTLPSSTTPEDAPQSGQHDLLQEHTVHHQPLPERPVEKQRHQEPLCRENQQSGGNLRNTFSTGYEPKEPATKELARISRTTDPYQLYDAQKELGEQDHQAPITEEVKEFGEIGTPTSNRTCTSTIPWKALHILISKMENYRTCSLHHCMPRKLWGNPTHQSCRRER